MADSLSVTEGCPIMLGMTDEERRQVLARCQREKYPPRESIIREGRATQMLWIVLEGRCEVVKSTKDGHEQQFAVLEPGAVFGEMSFFNPGPHSASVRTLSDVVVLRLAREDFDQLHTLDREATDKIRNNTVKILAERLRRMDEWTCEHFERPDAAGHREEWREFRRKLYTDWQF